MFVNSLDNHIPDNVDKPEKFEFTSRHPRPFLPQEQETESFLGRYFHPNHGDLQKLRQVSISGSVVSLMGKDAKDKSLVAKSWMREQWSSMLESPAYQEGEILFKEIKGVKFCGRDT